MVGQSLKSQWLIAARPDITKPEDLRGKIIGYGRVGSADYDEGAAVLLRAFKMEVGKDYKVISLPGEPERIAALVNGDVEAALISVPHAPRALNAGMKILLRTGDYISRAGGTIWTRKALGRRAARDGEEVHPRHRQGGDVLPREQGRLACDAEGASRRAERQGRQGRVGADPQHVRRRASEGACSATSSSSRRVTMIDAKQWAPDKPLPDPEQFLTRSLLESTLKDMKYVPTKLDAASN